MNDAKLTTLDQVREFLSGTAEVAFAPAADDAARYADIAQVLRRFRYAQLKRCDKGLLLRYLRSVSGYSRQQLTRLVAQFLDTGKIEQHYGPPRAGFACKYSDADVRLLADLDALHDTLSGPATKCLMQRAYQVFDDARFVRLQHISVAQLYNLRKRCLYQAVRVTRTKTWPTTIKIGVRRASRPESKPGYIRKAHRHPRRGIDSGHQGDLDGIKGLYYINAVDCIPQWELVASCEKISETFLLPVLKKLLANFPFVLYGFHADNGSEYVNHTVAKLLNKLNHCGFNSPPLAANKYGAMRSGQVLLNTPPLGAEIFILEFTRSRPRTNNDNGLAETKNGAIIRKQFGYAHIPQHYASQVNAVCAEHLNPYLNF